MLRKFIGSLFGLITFTAVFAFITIAALQGQAKIDNLIVPPSNWDLAIAIIVGVIFGFLTLITWPKEEQGRLKRKGRMKFYLPNS